MNIAFEYYRTRLPDILRYVGLCLACCVLSACATVMPQRSEVVSATLDEQLAPLDYYEWMQNAPETTLIVELFGLDINSASADPVVTAVRRSMILGTSALATSNTEQQALALIEEVASLQATDDIGKAYKMFAGVLQTVLQQREDLQTARATNQRALREIDTLKSRNKQLQQQIEELTSIEQQIIERERLNSLEP